MTKVPSRARLNECRNDRACAEVRLQLGDPASLQSVLHEPSGFATGHHPADSQGAPAGLVCYADRWDPTRLTLACTLSNPDLSAVVVAMSSPSDVESYAGVSFERQSGA